MELGLKGKIALVTGSSRGIGRGIALALADEGCDLLLTGRDAQALEAVAQSIRDKGRKAAARAVDLCEPRAGEILVEGVRREFGGLDILVNNAGATKRGDFFELTDADWEAGYALKFFAHVRLTRAAWPLLKERHGALVAIAGTSGRKPDKRFTIGSSVNAAVAAFTKCLADLGKEDGVRVNCIHPSLVETERQWRRIRAEVERTGQPEATIRAQFCRETGIIRFGKVEDVADFVTFIVSSRATWLHGATIPTAAKARAVTRARIYARLRDRIHEHPAHPGAHRFADVPNRIVMPAMTTRTADEEGYVTEDTIAYYQARARGGSASSPSDGFAGEAGRHRRRELGSTTTAFCRGLRVSWMKFIAPEPRPRFSSATAADIPAATSAARRPLRLRRSRIRFTRRRSKPSYRRK
jgi:3-oxoacyl-[acyl-carrier protein] reductase